MPRINVMTFRLDDIDAEAVREALVLRKSALYRHAGKVVLPDDTASDLTGALLAEVCRDWAEGLALGQVSLGERLLERATAQTAPHIADEPEPFHSYPEKPAAGKGA